MSIHNFSMKTIDNNDKSLKDYEGKVLLIVNVASECGLTPQYEGLEKLNKEYKDKKFMFIKENKIILLSEKKLITWNANKNEIFLRARFLNTNTIVILSSMKDNFKNNTIIKCKIM